MIIIIIVRSSSLARTQVDRARTVKIIYFFDFLFSDALCDCTRRFELKNLQCTRCMPMTGRAGREKLGSCSPGSYYTANLFGEGAYRILKKRASRLANCGEMSIQSINCGFYVQ